MGLQLSALPSTCPTQETFAVGPLGALADVSMPLLPVPSQSSLSISSVDKTIPQVAPPATTPSALQPASCDIPEEIGQKEADKAYCPLPRALWAGEKELAQQSAGHGQQSQGGAILQCCWLPSGGCQGLGRASFVPAGFGVSAAGPGGQGLSANKGSGRRRSLPGPFPPAEGLTVVLRSPQSHSSYLEVGQCGSSQDASREGVSLSSHSSRRSSHTTLSDSTCRCRGSPAGLGWRAERPPNAGVELGVIRWGWEGSAQCWD